MNATESTRKETTEQQRQHAPTFAKVLDGRKQPIGGLWVRNWRYYAQLQFEDGNTGETKDRRIPLIDNGTKPPVSTVAQAVAQMNRLKVKRSEDDLPILHRCPKFKDFVPISLNYIKAGQQDGQAMKKVNTIK